MRRTMIPRNEFWTHSHSYLFSSSVRNDIFIQKKCWFTEKKNHLHVFRQTYAAAAADIWMVSHHLSVSCPSRSIAFDLWCCALLCISKQTRAIITKLCVYKMNFWISKRKRRKTQNRRLAATPLPTSWSCSEIASFVLFHSKDGNSNNNYNIITLHTAAASHHSRAHTYTHTAHTHVRIPKSQQVIYRETSVGENMEWFLLWVD